ncbi:MAG: transaldolase family protein, partial [Desulfatiglandales bacterium]|nr:transaldolase family protein [Desulfatiglandales bacterium]
AQVTYALFKELFFSARFKNILEKGGSIQRLLWASTGTKDPSYSDVKYVEGLVAPQTINTLPPKTISNFRDHGVVREPLRENKEAALQLLEKVGNHGVDLEKIFEELEDEGVRAFETSYLELLNAIENKGKALAG